MLQLWYIYMEHSPINFIELKKQITEQCAKFDIICVKKVLNVFACVGIHYFWNNTKILVLLFASWEENKLAREWTVKGPFVLLKFKTRFQVKMEE